jgi:hypothetical protein
VHAAHRDAFRNALDRQPIRDVSAHVEQRRPELKGDRIHHTILEARRFQLRQLQDVAQGPAIADRGEHACDQVGERTS